MQGEGGHVSYGPLNDRESEVIKIMRQGMDHVSAEALVSGQGLVNIYQSLLVLEDKERSIART